jgi:hypothetical protein
MNIRTRGVQAEWILREIWIFARALFRKQVLRIVRVLISLQIDF